MRIALGTQSDGASIQPANNGGDNAAASLQQHLVTKGERYSHFGGIKRGQVARPTMLFVKLNFARYVGPMFVSGIWDDNERCCSMAFDDLQDRDQLYNNR